MNGGDVMVFKARRLRLFAVVMAICWIVGGITYLFRGDNGDCVLFLRYISSYTILGVAYSAIMIIGTIGEHIVLTADAVQGAEHSSFWKARRISVSLNSIDLSKSDKGSFWRNAVIVTSDGHKITIASYLGRKQVDKIFKELEQRLASKSSA